MSLASIAAPSRFCVILDNEYHKNVIMVVPVLLI